MSGKKVTVGMITLVGLLALGGCAKGENKKSDDVSLGMAAIQEASYDAAVEYFNHSIEEKKNLQLAYRGLGMAYMNLGNMRRHGMLCAGVAAGFLFCR